VVEQVEGLKARRGDLSGPVLAILVTLVLLAIGAAIVAYFVLLGTSPQQGVIAVVGQPMIMRLPPSDALGVDAFGAMVTIKNVGSANITIIKMGVEINARLNITGRMIDLFYPAGITKLAPGDAVTLGFLSVDGWSSIADRETVSGALIVEGVGTLEVVFRVVKTR
jgi:hypothetical protein